MTKIASTSVSSTPTARPTRIAAERPRAPGRDAHPEPDEAALGRERVGQALERVAQKAAREPAVRPSRTRPPARVRARREDQHPDCDEHHERADDDPVDPALVRHERQADQQEGDEREDVEGAVEHHGREPAAARVRAAGHPARAEEIPDAPREHVVHRHAGNDHLDEAALPEPGVGDAAPPRRLQPVDDPHARDGAEERQRPDAAKRAPHGAEVGSANREDEEDDRDRYPDGGSDHERSAPPGPGHVRSERSRTRTHHGRVRHDGHAPSIVEQAARGIGRGS